MNRAAEFHEFHRLGDVLVIWAARDECHTIHHVQDRNNAINNCCIYAYETHTHINISVILPLPSATKMSH